MTKTDNSARAGASLRIWTEEPDTTFISEALRTTQAEQHRRGELRSPNNPKSSRFEQSEWIHRSPLEDSATLQEHISVLLKLLEVRCVELGGIRHRIASLEIFCMFSSENGQGSAELDADLLKRLAAQEVDLIIDLYPPTGGG